MDAYWVAAGVLGAIVGAPVGWFLADWIIGRRNRRAAIERRLANWAG